MNRSSVTELIPGIPVKSSPADRVYSKPAFRRVLQRERCRADRNSHGFSLAVFRVGPSAGEEVRQELIHTLASRVRFTDELGWVGADELGVLLPDTYEDGASLFGNQMLRVFSLVGLSAECRVHPYAGGYVPDHHAPAARQLWFPEVAGMKVGGKEPPTVKVCQDSLEPYLAEPHPVGKRVLDLCGASLALLLLSPVMAVTALLIKLVSRGPVLFRQERIGYMGRPFQCLKFRTMRVNAETGTHQRHFSGLIRSEAPMVKLDNGKDPRIIPFGSALRMTGIDELPQLINVLRGEMSLIGPRPCIPYEYREYKTWHRRRVDTAPGLTGLWQVSGKNRTTFSEMMRLDISYAKKRSLWFDLAILIRTVPAIVQQVRDSLRRKPIAPPPAFS